MSFLLKVAIRKEKKNNIISGAIGGATLGSGLGVLTHQFGNNKFAPDELTQGKIKRGAEEIFDKIYSSIPKGEAGPFESLLRSKGQSFLKNEGVKNSIRKSIEEHLVNMYTDTNKLLNNKTESLLRSVGKKGLIGAGAGVLGALIYNAGSKSSNKIDSEISINNRQLNNPYGMNRRYNRYAPLNYSNRIGYRMR